jgi:tyrosine-protein phosphatase YwqE
MHMDFFDLKVNIIPEIDPYCENISESISALNKMAKNSIKKVCAMPLSIDIQDEYNIENILVEIQKEASQISDLIIPKLIWGIEYPLNFDIASIDNLRSINNGKYVMVKFPTNDIPKDYQIQLRYLIAQGLTPIINNLENSLLSSKTKEVQSINEIGCLINIDMTNYFLNKSNKLNKFIIDLEKKDMIVLVSGFSKLTEGLYEKIVEFSELTKIEFSKLTKHYMSRNPDIIANSKNYK